MTGELVFRKSARSGDGPSCVEVAYSPADSPADSPSGAHVRDSKDAAGPVLAFTANDWHAFTEAAKTGQFDNR